jgi:hypothetical protein
MPLVYSLESHGFKMKVSLLELSFLSQVLCITCISKKIIWKSFELNFKVAIALQPMLGGCFISVFQMAKPYPTIN